MGAPDLASFLSKALYLTLWLSLPPIVAAAAIGLVFSMLQALTQIQEQTLSFAVKLVAVCVTLVLTARWMGGELYNYTLYIFELFPVIAQ